MHTLSIILGLVSCLQITLLPSFALAQSFSFPSNGLSSNSLITTKNAIISSPGILTLDARTSYSEAFYSTKLSSLVDPSSHAALSFNSFFSWSTNYTYGNGTLAFFIGSDSNAVYQALQSPGTASNTFAVEFNNSCLVNDNGSPQDYGGDQFWGGRGYGEHGPDSFFGGVPGMQVIGFVNGTTSQFQWQGVAQQEWPGPQQWPTASCSAPGPADPSTWLYQYQVAVEYNVSANRITVAMASCGPLNFMPPVSITQNLTGVLTSTMSVGFIAMKGGIFNISQWNFTSNATSPYLESLSLLAASSSNTPGVDGAPSSGGNSKNTKSYIVGFSVLGGGIGMAMVVAGACFIMRKPRTKRSKVVYAVSSDIEGPIKPVIPITNVKANPNHGQERDTTPLNFPRAADSAGFQVSGTASWLKPATAR